MSLTPCLMVSPLRRKPWKVLQAAAGRNHSAMIVEAEVHLSDLQ